MTEIEKASNGINIDSIRELNKVILRGYRVFRPKTGGDKVDADKGTEIFSAYLTQPVGNFSAGLQMNSLMNEFVKALSSSFIGGLVNSKFAKIITRSQDASLAFNYDYNYQFTGTTEFSKSIKCELVTKNDFYEDVAQPLWSLLEWLIPNETKKLSETTSMKEMNTRIMTNTASDGSKLFEQQWLADVAQFLWTTANEYIGGATMFEIPNQFKLDTKLRLHIGKYITLENIIIEKVDFDIPYLMYGDGLFDKVDVTLTVKGTRNTSIKTYDWLREIAYSGYSRNNDLASMPKRQPLNAKFETSKSGLITK